MKVIEVEYQKLKSHNQYDHTKLACRVALDEGDTAGNALRKAKEWVDNNLDNITDPGIPEPEYERALKIVEQAGKREDIIPF